jgi:hypothetical protein
VVGTALLNTSRTNRLRNGTLNFSCRCVNKFPVIIKPMITLHTTLETALLNNLQTKDMDIGPYVLLP